MAIVRRLPQVNHIKVMVRDDDSCRIHRCHECQLRCIHWLFRQVVMGDIKSMPDIRNLNPRKMSHKRRWCETAWSCQVAASGSTEVLGSCEVANTKYQRWQGALENEGTEHESLEYAVLMRGSLMYNHLWAAASF